MRTIWSDAGKRQATRSPADLLSQRNGCGVTELEHRTPCSPGRGGYALAALAALSCPCHAFLFALLLSGTAAGVFLNEYFGIVVALMSVVFLLSLSLAMKRLNASGPDSWAVADQRGRRACHGTVAERRAVPPLARDVP